MENEIKPTGIEVSNSAQILEIDWSDGHHSEYPLFGLRKNCPCVVCRGGHGQMNTFDRSLFFVEPTQHFEIEDIQQIGNHAIKIFWSDGHSNGMYQWDTLRAMCPCEECYPEQE
ncbi:MAG TPA: DUF971 domain-containing protein [Balneolaceae bacterium]|nr:DUF971 domain-containing protein [Balneolaceae bacterium]